MPKKSTTKEFVAKAKAIHGKRYKYHKTRYVNNKTDVIITCPKHGDFVQLPKNHLQYKGCPNCANSKSELLIANFLIKNSIEFETQARFERCRHKNPLPFDFYLPNKKMLIEFDGEQHFVPLKHFGGLERLKMTRKVDGIKTEFAKKNDFKLIRLDYRMNFSEIENKLKEKILWVS